MIQEDGCAVEEAQRPEPRLHALGNARTMYIRTYNCVKDSCTRDSALLL